MGEFWIDANSNGCILFLFIYFYYFLIKRWQELEKSEIYSLLLVADKFRFCDSILNI